MNNNEYGDGGINWYDVPFPDTGSTSEFSNSARHRAIETHIQQGYYNGNPSPEIIDQANRRHGLVIAGKGYNNHVENELREEVR